ncbi:MAG: ComEC/Rec2 family competence protein [Phycisphaerales bacterium]|jgi:competence protein ComEC|nr:ComEC/Rec2 family competence protein [Phycisphaerales bacterium]
MDRVRAGEGSSEGRTPPIFDPRARLGPASVRAWAVVACFAIGLGLARWAGEAGGGEAMLPSAAWFGLAAAMGGAGVLVRHRASAVLLSIGVVLLGAGWWTLRIEEPAAGSVGALVSSELRTEEAGSAAQTIARVEGIVRTPAEVHRAERSPLRPAWMGGDAWSFEVDVRRLALPEGEREAHGRVRVTVRGRDAPPIEVGRRVVVTGWLGAFGPPMNPGERDLRPWAAQDGIDARLFVESVDLVEAIPGEAGAASGALDRARAAWWRTRAVLRDRAERALGVREGDVETPRALLASVLLGTRDPVLDDARDDFVRTGLAHLLAISGAHLGVLVGVVIVLVRLTGDRGVLEWACAAGVVALYLVVVQGEAPVWRAGLVTLALVAGEAAGRRHERMAILAWVTIALLVARPLDLFTLGFQLSVGLTAALLWLYPLAEEALTGVRIAGLVRTRPRPVASAAMGATRRLFAASVMCALLAMPIAWAHTGRISPIATAATLVVLPVFMPMLALGYVSLIVGMVWPEAGAGIVRVLAWPAERVLALVDFIAMAPGASVRLAMSGAGVCAIVASAWVVWMVAWITRVRRGGVLTWASLVVLAACTGAAVWRAGGLERGVALRVDMLSVGDGSCVLVRSGREAMLWDCGSLGSDVGVRTVPRALTALGVTRIGTAFVTHANLDHFNGLPSLAHSIPIGRVHLGPGVLVRAQNERGGGEAAMLEMLVREGVRVELASAGDELSIGNARVRVLSPEEPWSMEEENDRSLVALVEVQTRAGVRRVLLTGDIGEEGIRRARALVEGEVGTTNAAAHVVDVLELPHHGSVNQESQRLVREWSPRVVMQSTGPRRASDERWAWARERSLWVTTAIDGAGWVEIGVDGRVTAGAARW